LHVTICNTPCRENINPVKRGKFTRYIMQRLETTNGKEKEKKNGEKEEEKFGHRR
jgi:hypothetical protein